jgi:hypothetical protein
MIDVRTRHLTDRLPITFTSIPSRSRRLRNPRSSTDAFSLDIDRYINAVKNLGSHVPKSYRAPEQIRTVRELLGGSGTVITRDGRIGARFPSAGLLHLA